MAEKWGLYAIAPENIADDEQYFLITEKYCLLYTNREPQGVKCKEITDLTILPPEAWAWVSSAIEEIRRKYLIEHQNEMLTAAKSFNERFIEELEAERQRMKGEE